MPRLVHDSRLNTWTLLLAGRTSLVLVAMAPCVSGATGAAFQLPAIREHMAIALHPAAQRVAASKSIQIVEKKLDTAIVGCIGMRRRVRRDHHVRHVP